MFKAGVQSRSGMWRAQAVNGRHAQNWGPEGAWGVARCGDSAFHWARVNVSGSKRLSNLQAHSAGRKELPPADNCFGDRRDSNAEGCYALEYMYLHL
ncbi:hypothetical protein PpBr36_08279 [Pyricularia pennisetigena]|uniref:hypothetical protein n=1 Tax=Pyricularia pennisetigena TaxID=1578925 RepID=UPI0011536335|nr:hypothetical protein PpBr36_08279 [Pyricularia pennisetigena]TLS24581.1 hypothetical protein PpBr36_08279 [Pyricularia pennisetigena]